ncbi:MAG: histidinol dehydrogenase [Mucilaginibacter polytrichastri]|nr:histidinol dehydrogenase [Mucilaginibacter polytrichastri]
MLREYTYRNLKADELQKLVTRNAVTSADIRSVVSEIIDEVEKRGDDALLDFAEKFDRIRPEKLFIDTDELDELAALVNADEKAAINLAYKNIDAFHRGQRLNEKELETTPGVTCWRESRAIDCVGLYIPGGTAVLPSTLLMLGIPARIAGCQRIVLCSPPQPDGKINPYIAYVARLLQIEKLFLAGGAQAVAAMAFGTKNIPKADKIFGPGNQYVTMAKTLIQNRSQTAIDLPAGPSEVLVIADETAHPAYIAADLLAQAEHGADSQVVLVSDSEKLVRNVQDKLEQQLAKLPRKEFAQKALDKSFAVLTDDLDDAIAFSNLYAPEHLIIETDDWESLTDKIVNAGSVFLGHLTPESAGDYASGTNHTLPTGGYARAYSGVSLDSFVKKITFQQITREGLENIGPAVETLAMIEGLDAHARAVTERLDALNRAGS